VASGTLDRALFRPPPGPARLPGLPCGARSHAERRTPGRCPAPRGAPRDAPGGPTPLRHPARVAPVPQHGETRALERTLVLLKPDALHRGLVGPILARFEAKGLRLVGLKLRRFDKRTIKKHYAVHKAKPFYNNLVGFMTSGPVVAIALAGVDAIEVVRNLVGATNSRKAAAGTIRGDFGMSFSNNLVHASDGAESAATELALFFPDKDELVDWEPANLAWVYSVAEELP
jgi:nucleoside-diphosphate kinase